MKKLLALILAGAMALSMVACGSSEPAADTGADAPAEGLKIAIVSSPSGVDDGNFNENNYNGILAFIAENEGATVTAKAVKEGRSKKVIVYKYKPKKGYHKKQGHRQAYTKLQIEKING